MIVCHCNRIDHTDIEAAAGALSEERPWTLITPVAVYKRLGKAPRCGGCLSLAARVIHGQSIAGVQPCAGCPMACDNDDSCPSIEVTVVVGLIAAE